MLCTIAKIHYNNKTMPQKLNYSFAKGCGKVSKENYSALNAELKEFLNCSTAQYYYLRRKKYVDMPAHVKTGIESIFSKYGISPEDIWEITPV